MPLSFVCILGGITTLIGSLRLATPVGYRTNLLVMGPGNYRFMDFVRAGTPLLIMIWLAFTMSAPWYYGL